MTAQTLLSPDPQVAAGCIALYIPACFHVLRVGGHAGEGDANDKIKTQSETIMQH